MPAMANAVIDPAAPKWGVARLYEGFTVLLEKLQPLAGLAMRLYVGKVFLVGWLKFSRWDSTIALFETSTTFRCFRRRWRR